MSVRNNSANNAPYKKPGVTGVNAVVGSPHYFQSHRLGVRILREALSKLAADGQHYISPTRQIYESWRFVVIAQRLEEVLPEYAWTMDCRAPVADTILAGRKGERKIKLYSQMKRPSMEN